MKDGSKEKEGIIDATELLLDQDIERILLSAYNRSCSPRDFSELHGIPLLACYRKIRKLEQMGLLKKVIAIGSNDGRNLDLYSADLDDAYVFYDEGKIKVRFKVVLQMKDDFRKRIESEVMARA